MCRQPSPCPGANVALALERAPAQSLGPQHRVILGKTKSKQAGSPSHFSASAAGLCASSHSHKAEESCWPLTQSPTSLVEKQASNLKIMTGLLSARPVSKY
ncbi:protein FAM154B [Platysternon megacephalum]|uniref:Protein FAM154B n=1 Tax=Platysternon megacephalum TaxID=55544 RepID=A0A4D9ERY5_9SAUR|nr:protein FAM154B [Platysternon megacephalum]